MARHLSDDTNAEPTPSEVAKPTDELDLLTSDALHMAPSSHLDGSRHVRERRNTYKRNLAIGLGVLGVSIALLLGIVLIWVNSLDRSMRMDPEENKALVESLAAPGVTGKEEKPDAFYALIVGSDARSGVEGARGDVMMLCRVDPDAGTRDTGTCA